ncbi:MAG: hypothetical protein H7337_20780 [Rhizobacter sp.]|nr:hypothetical protein [Rhizobacter sp.]
MKARWPQPDFLVTRCGPPRLAWLWAATGIVVLAVTLFEGFTLQRRVDAQQARTVNAMQRAAHAAPLRSTALVASTTASGDAKTGAAAIAAAQRVVAHLNHPWGPILASIEAETPAGLQWLVFDLDSDSPELRLEGLGSDVASVLSLVDVLSSRAGWSQVALSRLQTAEGAQARDTAGGAGWRFELRAVIDAARIAAANSATPKSDANR